MISSCKQFLVILSYQNVTTYIVLGIVPLFLLIQMHLPRLPNYMYREMWYTRRRLQENPSIEHLQKPSDFIISSPSVCYHNQSLDVLILITTIITHRVRRDNIRNSWAKVLKQNKHENMRYAFLLGLQSKNDTVDLREENRIYDDLIVQDFTDTYRNLTIKTLMGLHWSKVYCPNFRFLMKTDDDVYVNVMNILNLVHIQKLSGGITGNCFQTFKVTRKPGSRSYSSFREFPYESYPGFCSGGGYIMPKSVALDILSLSSTVPYFHLEDVYIGICARMLGYKLNGIKGFVFKKYTFKEGRCGLFGSERVYAILLANPNELVHIWAKCSQDINPQWKLKA